MIIIDPNPVRDIRKMDSTSSTSIQYFKFKIVMAESFWELSIGRGVNGIILKVHIYILVRITNKYQYEQF